MKQKTFHAFQKVVTEYIKTLDSSMKKILYVNNEAVSEHKTRVDFANSVNHKNDFGITAEWHSFATIHGKDPCNTVGSITKRQAATERLQCPYDKYDTQRLYEFAQENIHGIKHFYVTQTSQKLKQS
jgi:hypothetical protein